MSDRDLIFQEIKKALGTVPDKAVLPDWPENLPVSRHGAELPPWERFCQAFKAVNGVPLEGLEALGGFLREKECRAGYCDSALASHLAPFCSGIELMPDFDRSRAGEYEFGVTRAAGAIAETGTLVYLDSVTSSRLGALAPWIHAAVLDAENLWPDVPAAIKHFGGDPAAAFITGPSKTADVEGVLIEGVHGPGLQLCCLARETG